MPLPQNFIYEREKKQKTTGGGCKPKPPKH